MLAEPLSPPDARKLIRAIFAAGMVRFSRHALDELRADGLAEDDALAVLAGGIVEPAEFEGGSWRYRVRAGRVYVVIAFRSELSLIVVTAWRLK
jgi:hypothetical protein